MKLALPAREAPRHFLAIEGAAAIETEQVLLAGLAIEDALEARAMACVHGPAGLGKTFAAEHALASSGAEVAWVAFPNHPTPRQIADGLLVKLSGERVRGSRFRITEALLDLLDRDPLLIVVDEAQNLNRDCIEYLRHLHDHDRSSFALILIGGDGCWEVLSREPMLRSRIYRRVVFRRLSEREILEVIPRYHSLYREADPELILLINEECGKGEFRNWASFTRSAAALVTRRNSKGIDEAIARNVFSLMLGQASN